MKNKTMEYSFDTDLARRLQNPEFKKAYEDLEPEFMFVRALVEARKEKGLTQQELSQRTGINQADISKIENGKLSVSFKTMRKLADGLGKSLRIQLVDES